VDQQTIDLAAGGAKWQTYGRSIIGHPEDGYFLGPKGAVHLDASAWRRFIDKIFATVLNSKERKASPLDSEDRRRFLSAAGMLCTEGHLCPSCTEATILAPLGLKSISEVSAR